MKTLFRNRLFLTLMMIFSSFSVSSLWALSLTGGRSLQASVPFNFMAGDTQVPAGKYQVVQISDSGPTLELRNSDNSIEVLLPAHYSQNMMQPIASELVFDKIDNKDFLREVKMDGFTFQLTKTEQEAKLEMQGHKEEPYSLPATSMVKKAVKEVEHAF